MISTGSSSAKAASTGRMCAARLPDGSIDAADAVAQEAAPTVLISELVDRDT